MLEDSLMLLLVIWQDEYLNTKTASDNTENIEDAKILANLAARIARHITELQITIDDHHKAYQLPKEEGQNG